MCVCVCIRPTAFPFQPNKSQYKPTFTTASLSISWLLFHVVPSACSTRALFHPFGDSEEIVCARSPLVKLFYPPLSPFLFFPQSVPIPPNFSLPLSLSGLPDVLCQNQCISLTGSVVQKATKLTSAQQHIAIQSYPVTMTSPFETIRIERKKIAPQRALYQIQSEVSASCTSTNP